MVEDLDHLEIGVVGQRQDPVAGAEARVDATDRRSPRPADRPSRAGRGIQGHRGRRQRRCDPVACDDCRAHHRLGGDIGVGWSRCQLSAVQALVAQGALHGWPDGSPSSDRERMWSSQIGGQHLVRRLPHQGDQLSGVGQDRPPRCPRGPRCCPSNTSRGRVRQGPNPDGRIRRW
jgi:hypothetical protein